MNGVQLGLVRSIENKMNCPFGFCPASQAAIDGMLSHHGHRSRTKLLTELMTWPAESVRRALESWYADNDLLLASGRSRQEWIAAFDAYERHHRGASK